MPRLIRNTKFSKMPMAIIVYKPVKEESKYDIWSDSSYDNLDYEQLIAEEYHDLGY